VTVRVATYTRISTDEEHQPYSLEAQDERLRAYIRSQEGWELTRQFSDQMSGSTLERPNLQRALVEARAHRYDLLLVYRVDRLARSCGVSRGSCTTSTRPAWCSAPPRSRSIPEVPPAG
jgi:site-specific DNA recombinase